MEVVRSQAPGVVRGPPGPVKCSLDNLETVIMVVEGFGVHPYVAEQAFRLNAVLIDDKQLFKTQGVRDC